MQGVNPCPHPLFRGSQAGKAADFDSVNRWFKSSPRSHIGLVAQLVEQWSEIPCATGSSPVETTKFGAIVQLVRTLHCHCRGHGFESR